MKIAIYGSRRQQPHRDILRQFMANLVLSGAQLAIDTKLYNHLVADLELSVAGAECVHSFPEDADLVLSIGGDGTFLRAAAWASGRAPLLGINTGHLGYLSALTLEEAVRQVDNILGMKFRTEMRTCLLVASPDAGGCPVALNEVVVSKDENSSMINAHVVVDGHTLADYRADGVIVSTPTGSTAYNLSVGGPVVQPSAPVWIISPIAAHSLSLRPIVLSDTAAISIVAEGRGRTFRLTVDGRAKSLPMGTEVVLRRAPYRVAILQQPDRCFTDTLANKLS